MDFAGGAALQAVSERPLRRQAGIWFSMFVGNVGLYRLNIVNWVIWFGG